MTNPHEESNKEGAMSTPSTGAAPIISPETITLDANLGNDKEEVIGALAQLLAADGRTDNVAALTTAAMARESQSATGLPGGIAIPHCRDASITNASLGFARLDPKVDFGAPDGPADLVFLIAAPEGAGAEHMKLLSSLARALVKPDFVNALREAKEPTDVVALVDGVLNPAPKAPAAAACRRPRPPPRLRPGPEADKKIVAVTACPTGIAHTYMAADSLVAAGERAGVTVTVETQGSSGGSKLPAEVIAAADAVIFATDVGVKGRERFAGKPVIASGVKRAINEPDTMIADALRASLDPNAAKVAGDAGAAESGGPSGDVGWGTRMRQILLTGVSYMIPFVAAGGLLIALGFLFAGYEIANDAKTIVLDNSLFSLPDGGLIDLPRRGLLPARRHSPSASWCPRWPGTSPSRSPTDPASRPASPPARWRCSSAPASSAASSAA